VLTIKNKKMKKINLMKIFTLLSDKEMKKVTGESLTHSGSICNGRSQEQCSGPCGSGINYPDNNYCGWVNGSGMLGCYCASVSWTN
jgi:hypothetical protein